MKGRDGRQWRRLVAWARKELPPICHICGRAIDISLPWNDREGWTLDHRVPIAVAPHLAETPGNLAPAHRGCNSRKGANPSYRPDKPRQSRVW
ncbi:HNH endonuclease [Streptomyces sp. NPDC057854]